MRAILMAGAAALLASCATAIEADRPPTAQVSGQSSRLTQPPVSRSPADQNVLFWTAEQRSARFRDMESWFDGWEVAAAAKPRALLAGTPLSPTLGAEMRTAMRETGAAGVLVLQDGRVRFEEYGLGLAPADRWTSFSVAKSFTATLLGAAVRDGKIASLDDPVTRYLPGLAGSAYDGVTVRQLATMTSGVKWNEGYTNPASDVAVMNRFVAEYGAEAIVEQMKRLPREAPPGEKWVYKTGETNLLGLLVERAVGMPLAVYAKDKLVDPAGLEGGLFWMSQPGGGSIGGCCLSLRLRDYARVGQFALEGGGQVVPAGWFAEATRPQVQLGGGFGYGYQWWTYPGATYGAQGIFGQAITIVPSSRLVVAIVSNWDSATDRTSRDRWRALTARIAVEAGSPGESPAAQ